MFYVFPVFLARNPYALANLGGELFGADDHRALQLLEKAIQSEAESEGLRMRKDMAFGFWYYIITFNYNSFRILIGTEDFAKRNRNF